jgi:hypothetical protein
MQQVSPVTKNFVYPLNGQSSHLPFIPKAQIEEHSLTASTGSQDHFLFNCLYKQDNFSACGLQYWILESHSSDYKTFVFLAHNVIQSGEG